MLTLLATSVTPIPLPATRSLVVLLDATPHHLSRGDRVDVLVTRNGRSSKVLEAAPVVAVEPLGVTLEVSWAESGPFLESLDDGHPTVLVPPPTRSSFVDYFLVSGPPDSL